eukprot:440215-Lingulodinium_polyedra.AAC.1
MGLWHAISFPTCKACGRPWRPGKIALGHAGGDGNTRGYARNVTSKKAAQRLRAPVHHRASPSRARHT